MKFILITLNNDLFLSALIINVGNQQMQKQKRKAMAFYLDNKHSNDLYIHSFKTHLYL